MTGTHSHNVWSGKKVRIRAVEPGDAPLLRGWLDDTEGARRADRIRLPQSQESIRARAESLAKPDEGTDDRVLVIETLDGVPVGTISTIHCDPHNGVLGYGISIAGEHWRNGYASEAIKITFRYYFFERRYQKVQTHVYSFNGPSIELHKRLGFVQEGCLRRALYTGGEYHDKLVFGITKEEFAYHHPEFAYKINDL